MMLSDRSCATGDVLRGLLIFFDEFELHVRWIHRDVELKQKQQLPLRLGRCQWHQLDKPQDYYETFAQVQTILEWFQSVQRHRLTTQVVLRKAIKFASRRISIWRFNSLLASSTRRSLSNPIPLSLPACFSSVKELIWLFTAFILLNSRNNKRKSFCLHNGTVHQWRRLDRAGIVNSNSTTWFRQLTNARINQKQNHKLSCSRW